jgi:hypothetical protein
MMVFLLAAGAFIALVGAFLAGRAQGSAIARQIGAHVLPYLRKKAAEAQLELRPENPRASEADALLEACKLADQLTEHDRREVALSTTVQMQRPPQ